MSTTGEQTIYYCNRYAIFCTGANGRGECNTTACWNKQWTRLNDADTSIADTVKVVRCKDCKYLYKDGECPLRTWFTHTEEDFCSYGERLEK